MAILLAAERLFAQHGYHAVSIRQIAQTAGVPLALVGYYFGPKTSCSTPSSSTGRARPRPGWSCCDSVLDAPGPEAACEQVVEAFVRPVLAQRASEEGEYYAQLVARELGFQTPEATRVLTEYFDPLANRFIDALMAVRPGHDRACAAWAYQFALGALLHHISDHPRRPLSAGPEHAQRPAGSAAADPIHQRRHRCRHAGAAQRASPARLRPRRPHPQRRQDHETTPLPDHAARDRPSRRACPARTRSRPSS
jgi:AcrR family transcriptional regulator